MPRAHNPARRSARIRWVVALVVLAVTGAVIAVAAGADDRPDYRVATVTTDSTRQILDEVGVIEPVSQASVSFPTSGTVASVEVEPGATVAVGDVLATLDPTSLERALHEAQATLAQAELRLERALNGEDVGADGGAPTGINVSMAIGGDDVDVQLAGATAAEDPELRAAQEAVLAAQRQVDADLAAVDEALADAEALCSWPDDETDPGTDAADEPTDDTEGIQACRDALDAALVAQRTLAGSQRLLADAATALDELLAERAANLNTPAPTPQGPTGSVDSPSGGASPSTPTTGGSTTSSPSSADLIAYQAGVDAAEADVAVAEQAVTQATIVSPIAGTVVAVGVEPGHAVTVASADEAITIKGDGGYEVTTIVSVTELPDLEVGQTVSISPDGRGVQLEGEIVAIGVAATDGATGYPVTIALVDPADEALRNGAVASVAITTVGADDTLVVPTSAVTVDGTTATVTVYDGTDTEEVTVEIGAIGSTWTEIRSGLETGQQVVLADLGEPLPGTATESNDTGNGGVGGFQGGPRGAFGAGTPGG